MAEPFGRLAAALADRYRIERELGQGGMATVYLAEDLKHDRKVALKVLRPELAAVLGAERFVQEIKTTASLQHPNILPLFDSGRAVVPPLHGVERGTGGEAFLYYVMPYVEGETLRDKLNRETQLGIEEAVKITTEVADALQYAHQQGVIHRDIKPENILLHAGRPIVADFGIALAVSAAAGGRMTETGLSLGTPHYMSPEQATAEKDLTNRSDIYSLGAVLYEMLTGDPPHTGSSAQQIIMKIVTEEATPVTNVRKTVPPNIAAAVGKSLQKLRADRFDSARSFAEALRNPAFRVTPGAGEAFATQFPGQSPASRVTWRGRLRDPFLLGTALVAVTAIAVAIGLARRPLASSPIVPPIRFPIASTDSTPLLNNDPWPAAISPDGGTVVYAVGKTFTTWSLYARRTNQLEGHPIPGTEHTDLPFFSPDGQWLAFRAGQQLRKVRLDGSAPVTIANVAPGGADWTASDEIVLGGHDSVRGLSYVSAAGGEPVPLTHPGTLFHAFPIALPDGKTIVFTIWSGSLATAQLAITSLDDGRVTPLDLAGFRPLAALDGFLVYLRADGSVMAVTLDARRRTTVGTPISVHDPVPVGYHGDASAGIFVSHGGAMVTSKTDSSSRLVWMERDGSTVPGVSGTRVMAAPRLAPDGRQVAVVVTENGKRDVWIYDLTLSTFSKKLTSIGTVFDIEWSADGSRVLFIARGEGRDWAVWSQLATGGSPAKKLFEDSDQLLSFTPSPDGTSLVLTCLCGSGTDLVRVALDSVPATQPYRATKAFDYLPQFAPNGRWVAMVSNESGQAEIYVNSFPDRSGPIQISVNGGTEPAWTRDGTRLYYRSGTALLAARVTLSPTFRSMGIDTVLTNASLLADVVRAYDVTADGSRVLGLVQSVFELVVAPNWITEFRRRVAASKGRGAVR